MSYPMVHPNVFMDNSIIKSIADEAYWTVSNDKKRPVNARILLKSGDVYNAKFDGEWPLVTLHELDANVDLQSVNRAYRLRARENRVIVIDVEPEAPEEMKQQALAFPAHFTELSRNGGVHLLIQVPEDLITDENRYLFDDLSVFKEPVPLEEGKASRGAFFEVLLNDHFVTFTKKMVTEKPTVDYAVDLEAKAKLQEFLASVVTLDEERKKQRELAKQYQIGMMENLVDKEKKKLIESFIHIKPFDRVRETSGRKTVTDYGGDHSRYEMSVASSIASHVIKYHALAKDTLSFRDMADELTEQDLAYASYLLVKEAIPYREKHDEIRDGLPWLLFTSKRAYEFIKAKKAQNSK